MRWILGLAIFICFTVAGRYYSIHSFRNGTLAPRTPAAIPKMFDYSNLDGSALELAIQRRLLTGAEFKKTAGQVSLKLGHFVTRDSHGQAAFACDVFERLSLTFVAEGSAVAGERPMVTIEGNCETGRSANDIAPLWIPLEKILAETPGNLELTYMDENPVSLKFANMGEEWPQHWVLNSIKMFNKGDGRSIFIDSKSLQKVATDPIPMYW